MSALDVALDASGLAAEVASHSACAPLFGVRRADAFDAEDCLRFNDALAKMAVARTGEIDTVILAGRWPLNASGEREPGEAGARSAERRGGNEGVSTLRFRRLPSTSQKK